VSRASFVITAIAASGGASPQVTAPDDADLPAGAAPLEYSGYEARLGAFLHGVGGAEKNTYDLNPEFIFAKLPFGNDRWWRLLIPRPHLGGLINLEGRTSSGYAGALWTVPFRHRLFGELFFDGALHDGYTNDAPAGRSDLGCTILFHVGGSFGYRFSEHWSWMVTVDHESNGHSVFGIACEGQGAATHNQGFNDYGTRIGYAF
jgi:hypothetical protein